MKEEQVPLCPDCGRPTTKCVCEDYEEDEDDEWDEGY